MISRSLKETAQIAQAFIDKLERGGERAEIVALQGDLGSGKTAFTQEVGKMLGVQDDMQSPTFVIEKIYKIDFKGFKRLIHIDAYRIEKDSELINLGWKEITSDPDNLIFIEWPENVPALIPPYATRLKFKFIDEHIREISEEV